MLRNLDLAALRAVLTVAETGSVTRAAVALNLTQSAVSMQIRRLEEALGAPLFLRGQRRLIPAPAFQRLAGPARRLLGLNDEILRAFTPESGREVLRLGVPHDILAPQIPAILREFGLSHPQLRIALTTERSGLLRRRFEAGDFDFIVTTEPAPGPGGELLSNRRMVWAAAPGGQAARMRPLRVAFSARSIFRPEGIAALEAAGIPWEDAFEGDSTQLGDALVQAGQGVKIRLEGVEVPGFEMLGPDSGLPELGRYAICLYDAGTARSPAAEALRQALRSHYCLD
ncbi:MAG: LysR family transcriptional regulator [Sphingomonadales bacterium]|nr:LysR family transcriptional regulator [Sphingomonadales bacterium]